MTVDPETRVRHAPDTAWRVIAGEAFVVTSNNGVLHTLNGVGTTLWEALETPKSVSSLGELLTSRYEVESEEAVADAREYVETLVARGLLVKESADP